MLLVDRWITIREVADDVGISFGSSQANFAGVLGMKCLATIVAKLLNFEQKKRRINIAQKGHDW